MSEVSALQNLRTEFHRLLERAGMEKDVLEERYNNYPEKQAHLYWKAAGKYEALEEVNRMIESVKL